MKETNLIQYFTRFAIISSIYLTIKWKRIDAQYTESSIKFQEVMTKETDLLYEEITSNSDVDLFFHPDRKYIYSDTYVFDYPLPEVYRIALLIDPCRFLAHNCCVNAFGAAEYPALKIPMWEKERVFKPPRIASDTEVMINYNLVYEDGSIVPASAIRSADDDRYIDYSCLGRNNPHPYCMGVHYAVRRSSFRPACNDNNYSLSALDPCYTVDGVQQPYCVQVGISQNAYIPQCANLGDREKSRTEPDPHCGVFLEIHIPNGSPYEPEKTILSEARVTSDSVTGFSTMTLPLTYMQNTSRVLCSYTESLLRLGTVVYITQDAPICCCPPAYKKEQRKGSFWCPKGVANSGPFAAPISSLSDALAIDALSIAYPFCPIQINEHSDVIQCSVFDVVAQRNYVRNCSTLSYKPEIMDVTKYSSPDLQGHYLDYCPYTSSCGLLEPNGKCNIKDSTFSFVGMAGIITQLDNTQKIPKVWVSFNGGRTSYMFDQSAVRVETYKSMYEIWWVLRTPSNFIVQKRKGFNITDPPCTFDITNNRYFPYAMLDPLTGQPRDSAAK